MKELFNIQAKLRVAADWTMVWADLDAAQGLSRKKALWAYNLLLEADTDARIVNEAGQVVWTSETPEADYDPEPPEVRGVVNDTFAA